MKMNKRILSLILVIVMVLGMVPMATAADDAAATCTECGSVGGHTLGCSQFVIPTCEECHGDLLGEKAGHSTACSQYVAPETTPAPASEEGTEGTTEGTTVATTVATTEGATEGTTVATTEATTAPSTEPSTEATTEATTEPSTEPSTETTVATEPAVATELVEVGEVTKETSAEGVSIQVTGNIPDAVQLSAEYVTERSVFSFRGAAADSKFNPAVYDFLSEGDSVAFAFDITLTNDDGTVWQPADGEAVDVSLDVTPFDIADGAILGVVHEHEGVMSDRGAYIVEDGRIVFSTTGFSTYYFVNLSAIGFSEMMTPSTSNISIKSTILNYQSTVYKIRSVKYVTSSDNKKVELKSGTSSKVTINGNTVTVYDDYTIKLVNKNGFDGVVGFVVTYYTTEARMKKDTQNVQMVTLTWAGTDVNTVNAAKVNDNINFHLFNYGAAINSSKTIYQDGSGFLPFHQGGYEYYQDIDDRYTYKNAEGAIKTAYENKSEIDGEATGNSYAPEMSKTLIDGYPHMAKDVKKASVTNTSGVTTVYPDIKAGSLKYLFDKDKSLVKGSGALTSYSSLTSVWTGATELSEAKRTNTSRYTINSKNSYQSMHFQVNKGDSGLFQEVNGYYYYNSMDNAAYFDQTSGKFVLYDKTVVPKYQIADTNQDKESDVKKGNFLPFNKLTKNTVADVESLINVAKYIEDYNEKHSTSMITTYRTDWGAKEDADVFLLQNNDASRVDLWFGVSADFDFYMPENGQMPTGDMIYQFTGDDDVWVYIDGVLVLDIGGCHRPCTGTINFATGAVQFERSVNNYDTEALDAGESFVTVNTTLWDLYNEAYASLTKTQQDSEMGKKIKNMIVNGFVTLENGNKVFKNFTTHSFDFYYLERGGNISSMEMKFNLEPIPTGALTVEKKTEEVNVEYNDGEYEFIITGTNADASEPLSGFTYTKIGKGITDTAKVYTVGLDGKFTLKDGQKAIFTNIKGGDIITVTESQTLKYATKCVVTGTGTPIDKEDNSSGKLDFSSGDSSFEVVFTNTIDSHDLKITKVLVNEDGANVAADTKYTMKVQIKDTKEDSVLQPYTGVITVEGEEITNNEGTFELCYGQTALIENIPEGYEYKVEEINIPDAPAGFAYEDVKLSANSTGVFPVNGEDETFEPVEIEVTVTNTVIGLYGHLTISKDGIDELDHHEASGSNKEEQQSTVYVISGTSDSGTHINMEVVIVGNNSVTIRDIPVGDYTVTEKTDWSWRYDAVKVNETDAVANGKTVEIRGGQTTTVPFENSRERIYWLSGDNYKLNLFDGSAN